MEFPYSIQVVNLPSRGITYKGIDKINARALNVREGKALRTALDNNSYYEVALITNKIIKSCTDINPDIVTYGDKFYLLLWLRIQTLGDKFLVNFKCGLCGKTSSSVAINLSELKVKHLDKNYDGPVKVKFEEAGKSGVVELSIHTCKDEENVADFITTNNFKQEEDIFARYASTIRKVNDKEIPFEKAVALICTAKDGGNFYNIVKTFYDMCDHGIDLSTSVVCPSCEEASQVLIPFRPNLFKPPAFSKDDFRKSIVDKPKN